MFAKRLDLGVSQRVLIQVALDVVAPNPDHALLVMRNGSQDDCIDDREKARDDADAQAQRQNGHAGK